MYKYLVKYIILFYFIIIFYFYLIEDNSFLFNRRQSKKIIIQFRWYNSRCR